MRILLDWRMKWDCKDDDLEPEINMNFSTAQLEQEAENIEFPTFIRFYCRSIEIAPQRCPFWYIYGKPSLNYYFSNMYTLSYTSSVNPCPFPDRGRHL